MLNSNPFRIRATGFTLVETLMALLILIIVMGGSIAATRGLATQASVSDQSVEMGRLADQEVQALTILRDTAEGDAHHDSFANVTGLSGTATSTTGVVIASTSYGTYQDLSWCSFSSTCASNVVSPISNTPQCSAAICTLQQIATEIGGSDPTKEAELVAVSTQDIASTASACSKSPVLSMLTLTRSATASCIADTATSDWQFFTRSVTISDASTSTAAAPIYNVKVVVSSYPGGGASVERDVLLSDYSTTNL